MMEKVLVVNVEKCTGCRVCELACSAFHYKEFSPSRSRVSVISWEERGVDVPALCNQCEDAPCIKACPTGALYRVEGEILVRLDYERCIGCRACMYACPFGGIGWDPVERKVIKCDLCGGDPQCAKYCPTGAIEYVMANRAAVLKRRRASESLARYMKEVTGGR